MTITYIPSEFGSPDKDGEYEIKRKIKNDKRSFTIKCRAKRIGGSWYTMDNKRLRPEEVIAWGRKEIS